jgi:phospholipid/cholesterol/gamma-HCH transport system substrate-binding protein
MANNAAETLIGAAVLLTAGGFIAYASHTASIGVAGGEYELKASFRKAEGLVVGGDVRVAGVKVGTIRSLSLNMKTYQAVAVLAVANEVKLPDDSDAAIATEGLLGGGYVAITPGGSEVMLAPGDEIQFTQGSINLLDLVGKAISSSGSDK